MKYTCPCCGYKTLDEEPPGSFDICEICYWEDDNVQFDDPDFEGGANEVSLRQGQRNFIKHGACDSDHLESVRPPNCLDIKDAAWKML
ncbi:CPCC family cysteine-rich protein [Paenisporosarcina sp. FSL H8-0542]|uniref:CPCC family cysteine-rich protein n=1 Tax=Paenisporosarcina sp. FSL H8-0542 TaxID=2921401 RepID=UPI00315A4EB3